MKIQNKALAGSTLACRYTRDDDGVPVSAVGDEAGIFDMPERDAKLLLGTPGWVEVSAKPEAPKAPKTVSPPSPSMGEEATSNASSAPSDDFSEASSEESAEPAKRRRGR